MACSWGHRQFIDALGESQLPARMTNNRATAVVLFFNRIDRQNTVVQREPYRQFRKDSKNIAENSARLPAEETQHQLPPPSSLPILCLAKPLKTDILNVCGWLYIQLKRYLIKV